MALGKTKLIAAMAPGERLMFTQADPMKVSDRSFCSLTPSGKTVSRRAADQLIADGAVVAQADGLPGMGVAQTWALGS